MIDFKEVGLEDKEIVQSYLKKEEFLISDISFTNLYLWRKSRKIAYAIIKDCLVIQTTYSNQNPFYFFPVGDGDKFEVIKILQQHAQAMQQRLEFHSLEEKSLEFFNKFFSNLFVSKLNRDRSDYIYSIPELISLSGRKYHKKKNHLNKFLSLYPDFVYESITKDNAKVVLETWKKWFALQENPNEGLKNENVGIIDVLENWEVLAIDGGLIKIQDEIIAFSFGEKISNTMAVFHIEKANASFAGAYQAINQQFLKNAFNDLLYANREEDLGIEGLRKAKMSYNPVFLVDKYEVEFI